MIAIDTQTKPFFKARMPLPPGVNRSYKIVQIKQRAHTITRIGSTSELENFKFEAAMQLADSKYIKQNLINAIKKARKKTPLKVNVTFFFKTLWKNDVDGCIKAVIDATFKHLELNDNLVVQIQATKYVDADDPRCEIEVSCLCTVED